MQGRLDPPRSGTPTLGYPSDRHDLGRKIADSKHK
jgi:hypothetical protein